MGCAKSKEAQSQQGKRPFSFLSFHRRSSHRRSSHRGNNEGDRTHAHSHLHRLSNSQDVVANQSIKKNGNHSADTGDRISKEYSQGKTNCDETDQKASQQEPITPTTTPSSKAEVEAEAESRTVNARKSLEVAKDETSIDRPNFTTTNDKDVENDTSNSRPSFADNNHGFSFQVVTDTSPSNEPIVFESNMESKPMWLQMAANDTVPSSRTIISDFDPEIISTFRKALEELSPNCAAILRSPESEVFPSPGHRRLLSNDSKCGTPSPGHSRLPSKDAKNDAVTPRRQNKVVLYFTSLRGVRKTYEDCCNVRAILKDLGVKVDERDVSMHYGFRDELRQLLGTEGMLGKLPRMFVKGKYIGGAEDIQRMHDSGELQKVIKGLEMVDESHDSVCEICSDVRFVPCEMCSGSCKIYVEVDGYEGVNEVQGAAVGEGDGMGGFQRCPYCNENGIVRCPSCFSV